MRDYLTIIYTSIMNITHTINLVQNGAITAFEWYFISVDIATSGNL